MEFFKFVKGGIQPKRYRAGGVGNWSGHLPFAYDLVGAANPGLIVELGTHYGESYFGFCQAVAEHGIACSCYAVDSWTGEAHAGFYGEEVYQDVSTHNQAHYSSFSYLLRTTFDDALTNFAAESIDILHIDGLHTYEAVSHDLHSWLPKVKPGGIILLHDIMARHSDFGVWNVWRELAATGSHFAFLHSWGLGVFRKPGGDSIGNGLYDALFNSSLETQEHLREFYALCATKLEYAHDRKNRVGGPESKVLIQVYPCDVNGYSRDRCIDAYFNPREWAHVEIEIPPGLGQGALRIDPADRAGVIDIAGIALRGLVNGETLWSAKGPSELAALSRGASFAVLEGNEESGFCRFVSADSDPQLFLPELDGRFFDQPLLLQIWLRMKTDVESVLSTLGEHSRHTQDVYALGEAQDKVRQLEESYSAVVAERNSLASTCHKLQSELYVSKSEMRRMALERRTEEEALHQRRSEIEQYQTSQAELETRLSICEATLQGVLKSRSWRITAPLRNLLGR